MKRFFLSSLLVCVVVSFVHSQSFYAVRRERSLVLVVGTGSASYFGELKDNNKIDQKLNFTAGLQVYVTSRISARAEATWFQLSGSDATTKDGSLRKNYPLGSIVLIFFRAALRGFRLKAGMTSHRE